MLQLNVRYFEFFSVHFDIHPALILATIPLSSLVFFFFTFFFFSQQTHAPATHTHKQMQALATMYNVKYLFHGILFHKFFFFIEKKGKILT